MTKLNYRIFTAVTKKPMSEEHVNMLMDIMIMMDSDNYLTGMGGAIRNSKHYKEILEAFHRKKL